MKTLREEPDFGMGRTSVSWHADSSLEHESTIAVYCVHRAADGSWPLAADLMQPARKQSQRRKEKKPKRKAEEMEEGSGGSSNPGGALPPRGADPGQWRVGLRVVHDIEGPDSKANNDISQSKARKRDFRVKDRDGVRHSTIDDEVTPAIMVETRDGDCYYMLGDFNHREDSRYHRVPRAPAGTARPAAGGAEPACACLARRPPARGARGRVQLPLHQHAPCGPEGGTHLRLDQAAL